MSGLEPMAIVALGGVAFTLAAYFAVEAWQDRVLSPLMHVLYCAGVEPERMASPALAREIALAEERCPTCPAIGACRERLESGPLDGYRAFCPNAALIEHLMR